MLRATPQLFPRNPACAPDSLCLKGSPRLLLRGKKRKLAHASMSSITRVLFDVNMLVLDAMLEPDTLD